MGCSRGFAAGCLTLLILPTLARLGNWSYQWNRYAAFIKVAPAEVVRVTYSGGKNARTTVTYCYVVDGRPVETFDWQKGNYRNRFKAGDQVLTCSSSATAPHLPIVVTTKRGCPPRQSIWIMKNDRWQRDRR
ncbi:MAG: hypothetical protein M3Q65_22110 [Chloroflexota bacterium]|nr:hypothetical protein [Chloroflexota bacterium]